MDAPDAAGSASYPRCGDTLRLEFRLAEGRIQEARFCSTGCGAVKAAGSAATELLLERPVEEARNLSALELNEVLGGVPPAKRHALWMVLECLAEALGQRTPVQP